MLSPASELLPASEQLALELPAPPTTAETPLVPVRMVNEYVYCPRLAFLEWVDSEWADSGDTAEGRRVLVRLDAGGGRLPPPLVDSPKCTRCSLASICLPDEVTFFQRGLAPRPLNPSADTALPLY